MQAGLPFGFLVVLGPIALGVAMLGSMARRPLGGLLVSPSVPLAISALFLLMRPEGSRGMAESFLTGFVPLCLANGANSG